MFTLNKRLALLTLCLLPLALAACDNTPKKRTVCVTGLNEFERPIYRFWLDSDNKSGCFGNPPAKPSYANFGGGGGFACGCSVRTGDRVKLEWQFVRTRYEFDNNIAPITGETMVTIPEPESASSRYLFVGFKKDGSHPIVWKDNLGVPNIPPSKKRGDSDEQQ